MAIKSNAGYIKMFHNDKTHISEKNSINKWNKSKECMMCHYWYFLDEGYRYEAEANFWIKKYCNIDIRIFHYTCNIWVMSKTDETNR